MLSRAEDPTSSSADRVRCSTPIRLNEKIDRQTQSSIECYANSGLTAIKNRMQELDEEWDVERVLEANASTLALTGLALGITVNKRWLAVPAVVLSYLFQHGVQGWCPPLPILRRLGIRSPGEIDRGKYASKELLARR